MNQSKVERHINSNNDKFVAQKFIKEYYYVLESMQIETSFQATIDYVMFSELIRSMGFILNEE